MEEEKLYCSLCNKEIQVIDKFYHFSGKLNGELDNHIHVCLECLDNYDLHSKFVDIVTLNGDEEYMKNSSFDDLKGKTLTSIGGLSKHSDLVIFNCDDSSKFKMYHSQDCCESVSIADITGDILDIIGSEILLAEEVAGETPADYSFEYEPESYTWTFYKLSTIKGSITIRWLGESNGYYSESVDFARVE